MMLEKLDLRGIRNLQPTSLSFHPTANFFYGNNGSGKTSLLESIYLLGRGRSFRTSNPLSVLHSESDDFLLVGSIQPSDNQPTYPVGIQRKRSGDFLLKVAGERVYASSALAEALPLLMLNADSFLLLEGGPKGRRSYLDWGVFHVEHNYRAVFSRFQRVLRQRNSILRHGKINAKILTAWDLEFVELAGAIHQYRERYIAQLIPLVQQVVENLLQQPIDVKFDYYQGWDKNKLLQEILTTDFTGDQQQGITRHGPHRADIRIKVGRSMASELLSRGQIKMLVVAMQLAQGQLYNSLTDRRCVYLVDDLPSELDLEHRKRFLALLSDLKCQFFVTGVDRSSLINSWPESKLDECGVFHVEHGAITNEVLS